jgi:hypothetical protein
LLQLKVELLLDLRLEPFPRGRSGTRRVGSSLLGEGGGREGIGDGGGAALGGRPLLAVPLDLLPMLCQERLGFLLLMLHGLHLPHEVLDEVVLGLSLMVDL